MNAMPQKRNLATVCISIAYWFLPGNDSVVNRKGGSTRRGMSARQEVIVLALFMCEAV